MCQYFGNIIATSLKGRQTSLGFKGANEGCTIKLLHRATEFTESLQGPENKSERLNPVLAPTISLKVLLVTSLFIPYVS